MGRTAREKHFGFNSTEAGVPLDPMGSRRGASSPESQGNWSCGEDPPMCVGGRGGLGWKVDAERIPLCVLGGGLGWKVDARGQGVVLELKFCQDKRCAFPSCQGQRIKELLSQISGTRR